MVLNIYNKNIEISDIEEEIITNSGISLDSGFFELILDMNGVESFPENADMEECHDMLINALIEYDRLGKLGLNALIEEKMIDV